MKQALIITMAILLAGCATVSDEQTKLAHYEIVSKLCAYEGTALWLNGHPTDRDRFESATRALTALLAQERIQPADLALILTATLPTNELKGKNARIFLAGGLLLLVETTGQLYPQQEAVVRAVGRGILEGIQLALVK